MSTFITKANKTSPFTGMSPLDHQFNQYICIYISLLLENVGANHCVYVNPGTGMEFYSRGIHGQMDRNTSHNALSNLEEDSGKRLYFQPRKGPYGGMLTVTGQGLLFMELLSSTQRLELGTLSLNPMQKCP